MIDRYRLDGDVYEEASESGGWCQWADVRNMLLRLGYTEKEGKFTHVDRILNHELDEWYDDHIEAKIRIMEKEGYTE